MRKNELWDEPWVLSVLPAIFLWLSFPPFNLGLLQIPAFVLLIRLSVISVSVRQMIFYAYPSFILWNLLSTYWLMMATITGGAAAIVANAALMLIPLGLIRYVLLKKSGPILTSFLAAAIWVSYEYLHHQWDLAWPWLTLGNAWANLTAVIQYISVTGVWGISFWVVFTAALTYHAIVTRSKSIQKMAAAVLIVVPVLSLISIPFIHQPEDRPLDVLIVQPNSDSYEDYGGHPSLDALVTHLLTISDRGRTDSTEVILWPENAIDSPMTPDSQIFSRIRDSLDTWNTELITGSSYLKYYDEDDAPSLTRGVHNNRPYSIYNAAFHFSGNTTEIYEKGRLVPVVERFPFVEFFHAIDIFDGVDWGRYMGYGLGQSATVFDVDDAKTPALICYDSVFPGWVNQFVNNGADFLSIVTNDGWWGDSHGHIQHFAYARLRAIEQRRWIARSANNGISGIISPDGKIQAATDYWTEEVFSHRIYRSDHMTIYTRFGDWLPVFLLISATGWMVILIVKKN
ncbi:apolipoprotein N-acyltransferase [Rhodohalobacter sp. SW132]|uniref:apolipoprotein N-acyltransferase n=1 Tax=Rhodohalobacter sp. SW132 TaxID=2293433 RepID=UPI000E23CB30|nr:apolipoprotein N-acyltransferase [Rhodohalobacter sp. SW132]REL24102.1 apolipoprotein N-acyltransferase [Rhodohalobacter sp. SW132]